jgi:Fe-S-cluster containining protein
MKKFECNKCGECCKKFFVRESPEDKIPCFSTPIDICLTRMTLALWPWEKHLFKEEEITPAQIIYDLKNNKVIVVQYCLKTNYCPKLVNNQCSIYNDRPLICKLYPCPIGELAEGINPRSHICSAEPPLPEIIKELGVTSEDGVHARVISSEIYKKLYFRYGDLFIANFVYDQMARIIGEHLGRLIQEQKIKPAKRGYDFKFLIKRIQNSETIDVDQLIKDNFSLDVKDLVGPSTKTLTNHFNKDNDLN